MVQNINKVYSAKYPKSLIMIPEKDCHKSMKSCISILQTFHCLKLYLSQLLQQLAFETESPHFHYKSLTTTVAIPRSGVLASSSSSINIQFILKSSAQIQYLLEGFPPVSINLSILTPKALCLLLQLQHTTVPQPVD